MIYHKIQSVFKRDPITKYKTLLMDEYSIPEFEYLKDNEWAFTEKVDGTNIRIYWEDGKIRIEGRTDVAQIPAFLVNYLTDKFTNDLFKEFEQITLYGEGYGARIQKGGGNYIPDGVGFVLFDVNIARWWLKREVIEDIAHVMGIDVVPIIGRGTLSDLVSLVQGGFKSTWGDFQAEGIVARPSVELKDRAGRRIITKLKHKDF